MKKDSWYITMVVGLTGLVLMFLLSGCWSIAVNAGLQGADMGLKALTTYVKSSPTADKPDKETVLNSQYYFVPNAETIESVKKVLGKPDKIINIDEKGKKTIFEYHNKDQTLYRLYAFVDQTLKDSATFKNPPYDVKYYDEKKKDDKTFREYLINLFPVFREK